MTPTPESLLPYTVPFGPRVDRYEAIDPADPITQANFNMLMSEQFDRTLHAESIGGNAGFEQIGDELWGCLGVNGYAEGDSGKIMGIGNVQDLSPDIVANNTDFTLRLGFSMKQKEFKILNLCVDWHGSAAIGMSEAGLTRLLDAIALRNEAFRHEAAAYRSAKLAQGVAQQAVAAAVEPNYTLYRARPRLRNPFRK